MKTLLFSIPTVALIAFFSLTPSAQAPARRAGLHRLRQLTAHLHGVQRGEGRCRPPASAAAAKNF